MTHIQRFLCSLAFSLACSNTYAQVNPNEVKVSPYVRTDGTYVPAHVRTAPNLTNVDNFSTLGNTNPYTGREGWIYPDNRKSQNINYRNDNLSLDLYIKSLEATRRADSSISRVMMLFSDFPYANSYYPPSAEEFESFIKMKQAEADAARLTPEITFHNKYSKELRTGAVSILDTKIHC
jgi:hypothetical protein